MKVLIVIDMLKGFCVSGYPLSLSESTESVQHEIEKIILDYKHKNDEIFFLCDSHSEQDPEINNPFPKHCMAGTEESEIVERLQPYSSQDNIILKNTLSIIYNTSLLRRLQELQPSEIEIAGVCTEICVLFAVYELRIRGYKVNINVNAVLPLKLENQKLFLNYMNEFLGAEILMC